MGSSDLFFDKRCPFALIGAELATFALNLDPDNKEPTLSDIAAAVSKAGAKRSGRNELHALFASEDLAATEIDMGS